MSSAPADETTTPDVDFWETTARRLSLVEWAGLRPSRTRDALLATARQLAAGQETAR